MPTQVLTLCRLLGLKTFVLHFLGPLSYFYLLLGLLRVFDDYSGNAC